MLYKYTRKWKICDDVEFLTRHRMRAKWHELFGLYPRQDHAITPEKIQQVFQATYPDSIFVCAGASDSTDATYLLYKLACGNMIGTGFREETPLPAAKVLRLRELQNYSLCNDDSISDVLGEFCDMLSLRETYTRLYGSEPEDLSGDYESYAEYGRMQTRVYAIAMGLLARGKQKHNYILDPNPSISNCSTMSFTKTRNFDPFVIKFDLLNADGGIVI